MKMIKIMIPAGYAKSIQHVEVSLKTAKGVKKLKLDPTIYESIQKERVSVGDVIYIESNTGSVRVRMENLLSFLLLFIKPQRLFWLSYFVYQVCFFKNSKMTL